MLLQSEQKRMAQTIQEQMEMLKELQSYRSGIEKLEKSLETATDPQERKRRISMIDEWKSESSTIAQKLQNHMEELDRERSRSNSLVSREELASVNTEPMRPPKAPSKGTALIHAAEHLEMEGQLTSAIKLYSDGISKLDRDWLSVKALRGTDQEEESARRATVARYRERVAILQQRQADTKRRPKLQEGNVRSTRSLDKELGTQMLKTAEELEAEGQLQAAFKCYTQGIDLLVASLKTCNVSQESQRRPVINRYRGKMNALRLKLKNEDRPGIDGQLPSYPSPGAGGGFTSSRRANSSGTRRQTTRRTQLRNGNKKRKNGKKTKVLSDRDQAFQDRLAADILDEDSPQVFFWHIQGLVSVKKMLYESIILPVLRPDIFTGLRAAPKGLLLFGPPGNGKTMVAKAVATECKSTFFNISAASLTSRYVGEGEGMMRQMFELARDRQPSVIFIDEIDSLLTSRGSKNEMESSRRMKTEFLVQFDGVLTKEAAKSRVLVIGATNLPQQLDDAVLRRFGKRIMVPLPDADTRKSLITALLERSKAHQPYQIGSSDLKQIVKQSEGYSCSDLTMLCQESAMGPIRDTRGNIADLDLRDLAPISFKHFRDAMKNVRASLPSESIKEYDNWNSRYGSQLEFAGSALPEHMTKPPSTKHCNV